MEEQLLWNFEQACKKLNKTPWGLRWLVRTRNVPIVRIGRKIYFDPVEIKKWIDQQKIPVQTESKR